MGRMVVTPGGSPHWVDEGRRYKQFGKNGKMNGMRKEKKQKMKEIEENVKKCW